jgi:hypothetical protein
MAPAAIQATWSMRSRNGGAQAVAPPRTVSREERMAALRFNIDTCHVWASDGPFVAQVLDGGSIPPPIWAERRLVELGRDPADWQNTFQED